MMTSATSSTPDDFAKLTHGNYHTWAPQMTAKLQWLSIWHMCTGDESVPSACPTALIPDSATILERIALQQNHQEEVQAYESACQCNDQAVGMIKTHIKASQYEGLDEKSVKEVWDTLVTRHKSIHTGLSAFYTKLAILEKKYTMEKICMNT
ncbi:hypothetical protein L208DRAFT_1381933 [Tricholoma matsutake]|nr:hypothetical protein L208DRAFT_1381933 [Tricholoma matsutake 945]